MWGCAGLCGAVRGYAGLCGPMRGYAGLCGPMRAYASLCGPMRAYAGLCGPMRGYAGLCGDMRAGENSCPPTTCNDMSAHGFSQIAAGHSLSRLALRDLCEHSLIILRSLTPREITLPVERRPIVVYTDGAFEGTKATWRAILIDPITGTRLCFAGAVPAFLLDAWKDLVGQQLISQIEFYAVVCLRWRTRHLIHLRRVLLFLDNEACRFALIKGRSASDPMFRMAHSCACMEASMPAFTWIERVASYSNPADLPSREQWEEACYKWNLQFVGDIVLPSELLTSLVDGVPFPEATVKQGDLEWVMVPRGKKEMTQTKGKS